MSNMSASPRMNDLEKNHTDSPIGGPPYHLGSNESTEAVLRRAKTAGSSISITPEVFESLFLAPKQRVANDLRKTFGNPTPLGLVGFLLALTPLSNVLMEWRGSGGNAGGAAEVGSYYFFGGLLMTLGGILEFVLGNTFPFVVFGSFGAFWLSFGATLTPFYNASIAYDPSHPAASSSNPTFAASFGFLYMYMALLCLVFLICSIRTNVIFVGIFLMLKLTFVCLAASDWHTAQGQDHSGLALSCQHGAGGVAFIACLLGWYLLLVQLLASVDFPFELPVGDLSRLVKGASQKGKGE